MTMNNLGWAIKPFSKLIGLAADSSVTVDLRDTDGNLVKCNYINVQVSNGAAVGPYNVRPEITYTVDNLETSATTGIETRAGAGCAIGLVESTIPTVIRTSAGEFFNQVIIENDANSDVNFVITYGVVFAVNPLETLKITTRGN